MRSAIKPEYQDTWFAVPKTLIQAYMPTIGINSLTLYIILSCFQNENGQIEEPLNKLRDRSGMRNMKILLNLDYLKRMHLLNENINANKKILELAFKPQPIPKNKIISKKRTNV